jgi:hydrogenase maturation protease
MTPRVLVAGIGNIFFGDDSFGVEVVRRLALRPLPEGVRVVDFGIRGFDLAYALLDEYAGVVLVDAVQRGGPPGTLYVLEPDLGAAEAPLAPEADLSPHGMQPDRVFRLVRELGGKPRNVRIVGCEPATFGSEEDPAMGLSLEVDAVVEVAVHLVEQLVRQMLKEAAPSD